MIRLISPFIFLFALSACAFTDVNIPLNQQVVSGAHPAKQPGSSIVITSIEDIRTDKTRVGVVRNGYGADTASVITKGDVKKWISDSLISTLKNADYSVQNNPNANQQDPRSVYLSGKIFRVFSDIRPDIFKVILTGEVQALMTAHVNNQKFEKTIEGFGESEAFIGATDGYRISLERALSDFVKKTSVWIRSLN